MTIIVFLSIIKDLNDGGRVMKTSAMHKKDVLIITNSIPHYRIPLYFSLGERVNLTILHSGALVGGKYNFIELTSEKRQFGPFWIQIGLRKLSLESYSAVIYMCDLRWVLSIYSFFKFRKQVPSIWWGGWHTNKVIPDWVRLNLMGRAHANIFYCNRHRDEFVEKGLESGNSFVANNTVYLESATDSSKYLKKKKLIFVGSLNERKRLELVLYAIKQLSSDNIRFDFDIVGSGQCGEDLKQLTGELGISEQIHFHGKIENPSRLALLYADSIAAISPGQAGLSVLQSMAMGVPFITCYGAISGGETDNIVSGVNGMILPNVSVEAIVDLLSEYSRGGVDFLEMGRNAYITYNEEASIDKMVDAFVASTNYKRP